VKGLEPAAAYASLNGTSYLVGQWVPLDMDVGGIWRYFGNYSFFGAPFIWTTLHDFGGNDGLKVCAGCVLAVCWLAVCWLSAC